VLPTAGNSAELTLLFPAEHCMNENANDEVWSQHNVWDAAHRSNRSLASQSLPLRRNQAIAPLTDAVNITIAICFQFLSSPTFSARSGSFWAVDSRFPRRLSRSLMSPLKSANLVSTLEKPTRISSLSPLTEAVRSAIAVFNSLIS
jgi:hypothetical protein